LQTNFVTDPTLEDKGAGAGPTFEGDKQATRGFKQTAGVIEGRPGIIESAGIDPLNENSNKGKACIPMWSSLSLKTLSPVDDGWANATSHPTTERGPGIADRASNAADAVKEAVFGK